MTMSRSRALAVLVLVSALATASAAAASETFAIDPAHSQVRFRIRHLVSNVGGNFGTFSGSIELDRQEPTTSSVTFTIDTASIDTGNAKRDEHLRSPDFFDAAKHPQISFASTRIARGARPNVYDVTGRFTMHGVTREITIPVEMLGITKGMRGLDVAGFHAEFTLNRKEYGIEWNRALDTGGVVLGDEVTCEIDLEAVQKPADPPAAPR